MIYPQGCLAFGFFIGNVAMNATMQTNHSIVAWTFCEPKPLYNAGC